ncbi:hypothetical protein CPT_Metamorpho_197 [Klebsiella phage Metamorpho]|nr:hypothetical protein CPT_Metamorpho_197 [Klebsiella phage Metamorpho]
MKQFIRTKMEEGFVEKTLKVGDKVEIGFDNQSIRVALEVDFISNFSIGCGRTLAIFFKSKDTKIVVYYDYNSHETTTVDYPVDGFRGMHTDNYLNELEDDGFYICKLLPGGVKSTINLSNLTYTTVEKRKVNIPLKAGDKFSTTNNNYEVLAIAADGSMFCQHDKGTAHVFRTNDISLVNSMLDVTVGEPSEK